MYKVHLLTDTDVTFLLASGGHNAGIVSEPGRDGSSYQARTQTLGEHYIDPDTWAAEAPVQEGSWWPAWFAWLTARSGAPGAPPPLGAAAAGYPPLIDAPGAYVHQQ